MTGSIDSGSVDSWRQESRAGAPEASVVIGFDRDRANRAVLATAVDLGRRLRAHLYAVHVLDLRDFPVDPDDPGW